MLRSFGHAIDGLAELLRTQRNFRVHLAVALLVVILAAALGFSAVEWAVLVVTITLVLATEGLNTGIEIAVTLASPERRPEAKAAKNIAAGAVLLSAIASVVIGGLLFLPHVQHALTP
jgi:undecaprenol kinase